jgi:hypothetical protein
VETTELGVNVAVAPEGNPVTLKVTVHGSLLPPNLTLTEVAAVVP